MVHGTEIWAEVIYGQFFANSTVPHSGAWCARRLTGPHGWVTWSWATDVIARKFNSKAVVEDYCAEIVYEHTHLNKLQLRVSDWWRHNLQVKDNFVCICYVLKVLPFIDVSPRNIICFVIHNGLHLCSFMMRLIADHPRHRSKAPEK